MSADISSVKAGLAIVLIGLFFNIGMGISFGVNEDAYQEALRLIRSFITNPVRTRFGGTHYGRISTPAVSLRLAWV